MTEPPSIRNHPDLERGEKGLLRKGEEMAGISHEDMAEKHCSFRTPHVPGESDRGHHPRSCAALMHNKAHLLPCASKAI